MSFRRLSHLAATLIALVSATSQEVATEELLNGGPTANNSSNNVDSVQSVCTQFVSLQCRLDTENQIKVLSGLTLESLGNLQSYRSGAALLDECWKCLSSDNLEGMCLALNHGKSVVMEKILLPDPAPCQSYGTASAWIQEETVCEENITLKCDDETDGQIKHLNSLTFDTIGNLQSYHVGAELLDRCWKCMSEDNLESICLALDHAKSVVKERIFLSNPIPCQTQLHTRPDTAPLNDQSNGLPTAIYYIQSEYKLDRSMTLWCLQPINVRENANLNVRPCQNRTKQKWFFDDDGNGMLRLSQNPDFCVINVRGKLLKLGLCTDRNIAAFSFDEEKSGILALKKNGCKKFYFGFNMARQNGRVRLYKEDSINESISLWSLKRNSD